MAKKPKQKPRKLTAAEKRLNRVRSANRSAGWMAGADHMERRHHGTIRRLQEEILALKSNAPVYQGPSTYERGCIDGRAAGFEAGRLVGITIGADRVRALFEAQLREPGSAWERVCESQPDTQPE